MSELSAKISEFKGQRQTSEIIESAGISRQTFRKIELGDSVKLSTLRAISNAIGATDEQWLELLVAWLKNEAGTEARKIWIESRADKAKESHQPSGTARAMMAFEQLNAGEREQILLAMQRKEVIACLPAINRVWEKFNK